ncbi:MAG: GMC family oxidoreductase [Fimbriimonas sp.]
MARPRARSSRGLGVRSFSHGEEVDVVVVGTGAGGAPLLARLAEAGLRVVALEAGPWHDPEAWPTDERAQADLFWNDDRISGGATPLALGRNNSGTGVGGSTLHYTAYTPRPQPDDMRLRSEFGVGEDWPISFASLVPYLEEAESFLGVSGPTPYPWGPPRRSGYPLAPLHLNAPAQLVARGCDALGIPTSPAPNAALSAPYRGRPACRNRGFCQAGCTVGAKASMDVTYIPRAVAAGAEIRPHTFVERIEMGTDGRVRAVTYRDREGRESRQPCRTLFLCAGAIETPRLLLINELANASGQVGRNLLAHPGLQLWATFAAETRPWKGIPGGLISEHFHRPSDADFAGGYLIQSLGVMPVTYASQVARARGLWGTALRDHMERYLHVAGVNILGECLPDSENRVELTAEVDARGLPVPRILFSKGQNERRLSAHAESVMRQILMAAGGADLWVYDRFAHVLGTCRMGTDSARAVVDSDGRCFDVPNLYIADASIFPSAMSVNPALTIIALATRIADRFLERVARSDV